MESGDQKGELSLPTTQPQLQTQQEGTILASPTEGRLPLYNPFFISDSASHLPLLLYKRMVSLFPGLTCGLPYIACIEL